MARRIVVRDARVAVVDVARGATRVRANSALWVARATFLLHHPPVPTMPLVDLQPR
ncbi:MAG: hypothetical protein ACRDYW_01310 [Acidimicrobiales bacterium]